MYSSGIGSSYLLHWLIDIYYLNYVMIVFCHKNETRVFCITCSKNWLQIFFFDFKQLRRTSVQKKNYGMQGSKI